MSVTLGYTNVRTVCAMRKELELSSDGSGCGSSSAVLDLILRQTVGLAHRAEYNRRPFCNF